MAFEQPCLKVTFAAAGDLSTKQFYIMKLDSNGRVTVCTGTTDIPIGVLQNKPSALGEAADVMISGVTKISSDEALACGNSLATSADGQAQVLVIGTETTVYSIGQCIGASAAAAGLATAVIECAKPSRAA